jgi:hypothetical protein
MKIDWTLIWEAVKEPLRELVLAAIPGLLAYLGTVSAPWAIVLYAALRTLDSYLHELGKENSTKTKKSPLLTGLTRF